MLGAGTAIYFVSRADLEHAQGLLVVAAAAAAFVRPPVVGIALLAVLIAVGVTNRGVALLRPPDLEPYGTVLVPPAEAEALPQLVDAVQQLVPPGEPIYVAPLRSDLVSFSNPLLHRLDGPAERAAPRRAAAGQAGGAAAHHRRAGSRASRA